MKIEAVLQQIEVIAAVDSKARTRPEAEEILRDILIGSPTGARVRWTVSDAKTLLFCARKPRRINNHKTLNPKPDIPQIFNTKP